MKSIFLWMTVVLLIGLTGCSSDAPQIQISEESVEIPMLQMNEVPQEDVQVVTDDKGLQNSTLRPEVSNLNHLTDEEQAQLYHLIELIMEECESTNQTVESFEILQEFFTAVPSHVRECLPEEIGSLHSNLSINYRWNLLPASLTDSEQDKLKNLTNMIHTEYNNPNKTKESMDAVFFEFYRIFYSSPHIIICLSAESERLLNDQMTTEYGMKYGWEALNTVEREAQETVEEVS